MQNSNFRNKRIKSRLIVFALGLLIALLAFVYINKNEVEKVDVVSEVKAYMGEVNDSIKYGVSGVVEASDSLTLYAKRSGFVRQISVVEGDEVERGETLLLAVDPTTEARLGVQEVAGALNTLKAKSGVVEVNQKKQLAEIGYGESVALSAITNQGSEEAATASLRQLEAVLSEAEVVVPQALLFVAENKPLFTAKSMNIYNEVVKAFYGTEPNYLRDGVVKGGEGADLFGLINSATSSDLVVISKSVNAELINLLNLYQASESDFFDEDELASDAPELATYLELRSNIASLSSGLVAAASGASSLNDSSLITNIKNSNGTTSAFIGLGTAKELAEITAFIEGKTSELSSAEVNVLATELELGLTEAPFTGVVMEVLVTEGQYVNVGEPLLRLSGNEAKEMKVKLTGVGTSAKSGDAFMVDGKTVGVVGRVVPVLEAGSMTAYISITEPILLVGEVVRGEIAVVAGAGYKVIGRGYMQFDQSGPYVVTKAGEKIYFKIVYDEGLSLVVEGEREINEELVPAYGVRL